MEKLRDIIKDLKEICEEQKVFASHDMILDCATRIYNQGSINIQKKENIKAMQNNNFGKKQDQEPTQKQINFFKIHGIKEIPKTKDEATKMISTYLNNLQRKNI